MNGTAPAAISISVVMCVHNGERRVPLSLAALRRQAYSGPWDVVVVDNASTDATASAALTAGNGLPGLRVVFEPQPGLWNARLRGVAESKGDLIVFVDDDNLLSADYLGVAAAVMAREPEVALLNGRAELHRLGEMPDWFEQVQHCFAVGPQFAAGGVIPTGQTLWGAGLVLRRSAFEQLRALQFRPLLAGRVLGKLLAGDDSELCLALGLLGWRAYYVQEVALHHAIDPGRVTFERLRELARGFGAGWLVVTTYRSFTDGAIRRALKRNAFTLLPGLLVRLAAAALRVAVSRRRVAARVEVWLFHSAIRQLLADASVLKTIRSTPFLVQVQARGVLPRPACVEGC